MCCVALSYGHVKLPRPDRASKRVSERATKELNVFLVRLAGALHTIRIYFFALQNGNRVSPFSAINSSLAAFSNAYEMKCGGADDGCRRILRIIPASQLILMHSTEFHIPGLGRGYDEIAK